MIVAGGDITSGQVFLVISVDIEYGLSTFRFLDTVAVAVVDKGRRSAVIGYGYGSVLKVPIDGLAAD